MTPSRLNPAAATRHEPMTLNIDQHRRAHMAGRTRRHTHRQGAGTSTHGGEAGTRGTSTHGRQAGARGKLAHTERGRGKLHKAQSLVRITNLQSPAGATDPQLLLTSRHETHDPDPSEPRSLHLESLSP